MSLFVLRLLALRSLVCRLFIEALSAILISIGLMSAVLAKSDGLKNEITFVSLKNLPFTETVTIAGHQLTGDSLTLTTINQLSLRGHEITVHRWQSPLSLDDVMAQLSMQVPKETVAWGEDGMISMLWQASDRSHNLLVTPLSDTSVEMVLSSIHLQRPDLTSDDRHDFQSRYDNRKEIKKIFTLMDPQAELLLDVKDKSVDLDSFTLLYAVMRKVTFVDLELRRRLKESGWLVGSEPERPGVDRPHYVIEAIRYQQQLRIDLINDFGKTFVHINQSGNLKLEHSEHNKRNEPKS